MKAVALSKGTLVALVAELVLALVQLSNGGTHVDSRDLPTGQQLPLTTTVALNVSGHAFTVRMPAPPRVTMAPVGADGSQSLLLDEVGGPRFGALFITRFGMQPIDPVRALQAMRQNMHAHFGARISVGPTRNTEVAGRPAAVAVVRFSSSGKELLEYRFTEDGVLVGFGILYYPGDRVTLDTGLAAMRSWHWSD